VARPGGTSDASHPPLGVAATLGTFSGIRCNRWVEIHSKRGCFDVHGDVDSFAQARHTESDVRAGHTSIMEGIQVSSGVSSCMTIRDGNMEGSP
jgi:hypothetical protein